MEELLDNNLGDKKLENAISEVAKESEAKVWHVEGATPKADALTQEKVVQVVRSQAVKPEDLVSVIEKINNNEKVILSNEASADQSFVAAEEDGSKEALDVPEDILLNVGWHPEDAEELKQVIYNHAEDLKKKGDGPDFILLLCAGLALLCFIVMLVTGIKKGFSSLMIVLLVVYVVVFVCAICTPLHVAISKYMWNKDFEKRFMVNRGYKDTIVLKASGIIFSTTEGLEEAFLFSELEGIYESESYIIFHKDDKRIFAAKTSDMDEELKTKIIAKVSK